MKLNFNSYKSFPLSFLFRSFLIIYLALCLSLSVCLSLSLFLSLSVSLYLCLSVCLSVYLSLLFLTLISCSLTHSVLSLSLSSLLISWPWIHLGRMWPSVVQTKLSVFLTSALASVWPDSTATQVELTLQRKKQWNLVL